jgi:Protein of unknown function (DUF2911)
MKFLSFCFLFILAIMFASSANAQWPGITIPPSGDNQHSINTQYIGPVEITIDYHSPNVHAPDGSDRHGKIWGVLVPYGMANLGFGTCGDKCPWRGGANENTVFRTSHDILVQGKPLKAGSYGLHFIPGQTEWTIIFSNNSASWGSFTYDEKEDALRVQAKPEKSEYNEWLTYDFTDRETDHATVALKWEDLQLPFKIEVPNIDDIYVGIIDKELRNSPGFTWQSWTAAAQYTLQANKHLDVGLKWADIAVHSPSYGTENFTTLITLSQLLDANGKETEGATVREAALNHPSATPNDIHQTARALQGRKKMDEAIKIFEFNAKRFPGQWPVEVGLTRAYSAKKNFAEALKHAKLALAQAPDGAKANVEGMIKKLEQNQDVN